MDLEAAGGKIGVSPDGLSFSVVIPSGGGNPVELTRLSPEILRSLEKLRREAEGR